MSDNERAAYVNAAARLERAGGRNPHDWLTAVHLANRGTAHNTILFFPWHRMFQNFYQEQIWRMDPNVVVPYWDWSADAFAMGRSPIFSNAWMGGNGRGGEGCISTGPFAGVRRAVSADGDPGCLSRAFNSGNTIRGIYDRTYMNNLIRYSRNFGQIWGGMENGPHSAVHYGIGGDMGTMQSSNDPIFFMHHGFVDKVWDDWQRTSPNRMYDFGG
ncbi:Di-copper centre-containing protein, partial [Ramicandelaber brevisporus]